MSLSNTSLPKPKNWQDFENKTRILFACVLDDPTTQQNGRSGQKQSGVDVYGYRNRNTSRLVGVQCKKKLEDAVTDKELRAEVDKAKTFKPKISEFILVTTAGRDQKIQESARIITEDFAKTDHPVIVSVWGWEDIEENAALHDVAWKAFDPTWTPFVEKGLEKLTLEIQELKQSIALSQKGTNPSSPSLTTESLNESDENTPRHGQITAYQRLIDDGHAKTALAQLVRLQNDEWSAASRSERYRILVGIASAKLKLGEIQQAGRLLLDAYKECPEHKNARKNLATGYLLINDHAQAAKLSREALANDSTNEDAARTLILALIDDKKCDDPLADLPATLHDAREVMVARIQFMRNRENLAWLNLAKKAAAIYPDSRLLKQFAAEAVLDEVVHKDRDVLIGGVFQSISAKEFNNAVETLYSVAKDAIEKGYALLPPIAHNAALALRFSNDFSRAKEILDASINQYPAEENLRLQRALIDFDEKGPDVAISILPSKPKDPETVGVLAEALAATGKLDEALALIDATDKSSLPDHVKLGFLAVRSRIMVARGEKEFAIKKITEEISKEPNNIPLRTLQIRIHRSIGDADGAGKTLEEAVAIVNDETNLPSRLALSFEAVQLGRNDLIVNLLKDRVATDRESDALHALIAASINTGSLVTARKILDSVSPSLRTKDWFIRADAILAINTGDPSADEKISGYLKESPNDAQMIIVRIGVWQRRGRDGDIQQFLQTINFTQLFGQAEERIRIAAFITHYGDASKGLECGYSVLMDNWDSPKAHLAYQGLIFLNEKIGTAMPSANLIAENTVVGILSEEGERRYRIEKGQYASFGDERIKPESDLALLLLGKQVGDKILLQERFGAKPVEVVWIKPVYIDAFHCSLEQFNERFPRATGLQKFKFDPSAQDPLEDVRAITKARAEADQRILAEYQAKNIPLSFAAALIGKDPLDAWSGLSVVNIPFQVCRGTHQEREEALQTIRKNDRKGCIVDAITLSVIRRLGVEKAIIEVCGPIHTPQAVVDLLAARALEAKLNMGTKQGFLAWREESLVYQEYSEEMLEKVSHECEKEVSWARSVITIVPAMPKKDFSPEARRAINMVGHAVCDPAVAADGNELLLLSEDMGFRIWSTGTFNISTTWLQPVLIAARDQGFLAPEEYCKATNMLAISGHTYTSLDHACLVSQTRKDNYELTKELSLLLRAVGGPAADLSTNIGVMSTFIDKILQECADEFKVMKIMSEAFYSITRERPEDQRQLIFLVLRMIRTKKSFMSNHALSWLIGHSIGMPYFNEILEAQKEINK